jgi:hypothetical protein
MIVKKGCLIKLRACGGKRIVRRFVGKKNGIVLICNDAEFRTARQENRKPLCVGFPVKDVIGVELRRVLKLLPDEDALGVRGKSSPAGTNSRASANRKR